MVSRGAISYLSYLVVAENVPSIIEHGILSHAAANSIEHVSVADAEVQARRAAVRLPSRRPLHEYANLYFWARNAMMYRLRDNPNLCVLKIDPEVMDLDGTFYSTKNCSASDAEFYPFTGEFQYLDRATLYAGSWMRNGVPDDDCRQRMQAELLVPDCVPTKYVSGVFFRSETQRGELSGYMGNLDQIVYPGLFFD